MRAHICRGNTGDPSFGTGRVHLLTTVMVDYSLHEAIVSRFLYLVFRFNHWLPKHSFLREIRVKEGLPEMQFIPCRLYWAENVPSHSSK